MIRLSIVYFLQCSHMTFVETLLPPANEVWGKVIFLHLSVTLFTGEGKYLGRYPPPRAGTPPGRYTPWAGTPHWAGTPPPGQVPPSQLYTPPLPRQVPPLPAMHAGIRSTSRLYASYWNVFLFSTLFFIVKTLIF